MSDEFNDLDELVNDDDDLSANFTKAASYVQGAAAKLDNNVLLNLYGYYKQSLEGPCATPKPGWFDMRGKSKWEAWKKLGDMPQNEAKVNYIKLVQEIHPDFETSTAGGDTWVKVSTLQNHENDETNESNDNTLIELIKKGDLKEVGNYLIESNALINEKGDDGLCPIHWAADRGLLNMLKIVIQHGGNVNARDDDGQTALHYAVSCGHIDCVEFLLENEADPKLKDNDGSDCFNAAEDEVIRNLLIKFVSL